MKNALLGLSIIAILSPATASAENFSSYMGVSIGHTEIDVSDEDVTDLAAVGVSVDDSDVGFKVYGGARLNKYLALEIYYVDLGEASLSKGVDSTSIQADGFGVSALGILPITNNFELFAKVGTFKWDVTLNSTVSGLSGGDDDLDETYGIGASYYMDEVSFRVEVERYGFGSEDVDMISAGVVYNY